MQTRVVLVDDHRLFREGVVALLSAQPGIEVVAQAGDAEEALQTIAAAAPDVIVVDLSMPGLSGLELGRILLARMPGAKLLALTMLDDERHVGEAMHSGFLGFVSKDDSTTSLVDAIRAVARGQRYLSPSVSTLGAGGDSAAASPLGKLTRREREIFDLTITGAMTSQIALQLHISKRTVETHRARILHKLSAHSAVDLVRLAARLGVLPADVKQ